MNEWQSETSVYVQEWLKFPTEWGHIVLRPEDILRVADVPEEGTQLYYIAHSRTEHQVFHAATITCTTQEAYAILTGESDGDV